MISVDTYDSVAAANTALNHRSKFMGGGTLMMRDVNYGEHDYDRIIRSTDPILKNIQVNMRSAVIGAGVTMSEVLAHRDLSFLAPAAKAVGGPAIRNMATIGGNLFAAAPFGDFTTALLALDARVNYASGNSESIENFLAARAAGASQLAVSVQLQVPERNTFKFKKVTRIKPKGVSVLSIAVVLRQRAGRLSEPKIAFGNMGKTPLRAKQAETFLENSLLNQAAITQAASLAMHDMQPQDDALATIWYRKQVAPIHLRRLLLEY